MSEEFKTTKEGFIYYESCEVKIRRADGMREWLEDNCKGRFDMVGIFDGSRVIFDDKNDAIAFRLRWDSGSQEISITDVYRFIIIYRDGIYEWFERNNIDSSRYWKEKYSGHRFIHLYVEGFGEIYSLHKEFEDSVLTMKKLVSMREEDKPVENTEKRDVNEIPGLQDDQIERLGYLSEECGEITGAIGKILRHGYKSSHPDEPQTINKEHLETELADLMFAMKLMYANGDIDLLEIEKKSQNKFDNPPKQWFHHQDWDKIRNLTHDT